MTNRVYIKFLPLLAAGISGFVLMGYEMLASRTIAPVFGSSIVTWMSIISFVLVGISVGNTLGAFISKKSTLHARSAFVWAFGLIAPLVLICFSVAGPLSLFLASSSMIAGSLIFSFLFVGIPSVFLGIISPLLVRMSVDRVDDSGFIAGSLSVSNTIGSVLGIFLVTLVGMPELGVRWSVFALSLIAWVVWVVWIFWYQKDTIQQSRTTVVAISTLFLFALLVWGASFPKERDGIVARSNTLYYDLVVTDLMLPGSGPIRALILDGDSHSLRGETLPPDYYVRMSSVFHNWKPEAKDILLLGGGAYTMPELFRKYFPDSLVRVFELDPRVVETVERYFGISPSIETRTGDARVRLAKDSTTYDIIFGDVYTGYISVPWNFLTQDFFVLTKKRLNKEGVFSFSFISTDDEGGENYLTHVRNTFASVYACNLELKFKNPGSNQVAFNRVFVGWNTDSCRSETFAGMISDPLLSRYVLGAIKTTDGRVWTDDKTQSELMMVPLGKKFLPARLAWLELLGAR